MALAPGKCVRVAVRDLVVRRSSRQKSPGTTSSAVSAKASSEAAR